MNDILIPLSLIEANPYQPRESEDPEHIKRLALSIASDGLMQVPAGRVIGAMKAPIPSAMLLEKGIENLLEARAIRVQLAFGHSRLAAYRFITDAGNPGYDKMPVRIVELSDEDMFRQGISENVARKDLNPLEEARAMARYRDEFGKDSAEIGKLFGLAESSVRGKLRLLSLPTDVQVQLAGQNVSETILRELTTWFDLPSHVREQEKNWGAPLLSMIVQGASAEQVRERVNRSISFNGVDMARCPWKHDQVFAGENIVGVCKGCAFRVAREKQTWCTKSDCYNAKKTLYKAGYLREASLVSGIAADPSIDEYSSITKFQYESEMATLAVARQAQCENLRLMYTERDNYYKDNSRVENYEHAQIICKKHKGFCTCQSAVKTGISLPQPDEEGGGVTSDDLKNVAREVRQQKRYNRDVIQSLTDRVTGLVAHEEKAGNPEAFRKILGRLAYEQHAKKVDTQRIIHEVANNLVTNIYSVEHYEPTPQEAVRAYNALLIALGLPELDGVPGVSTETQGKTLVEVLND